MPDPWFTAAQVQEAARNICWTEIGGGRILPPTDVATVLYVDANWHRHVYQARAALSAIPDPRAAARAEGFEAAKAAILRRIVLLKNSPTTDLIAAFNSGIAMCQAAIAALKPEPAAPPQPTFAGGFDAAKAAIFAETERRWPEADDLLDWIVDLKPELKL